MKSVIKLFSALPIKEKKDKIASKELLQKTLRRGFVFSPEVVYNYSEQELLDLIKIIEEEIGLTPEQMNNTFQKSWKKVSEAPLIQLVIEQLIHYFTTYGFERLGIYDENSVYVPAGDIDIPNLTSDFKIVVINGYTKEELKEKLLSLLNTGIALAEDTKKDVIDIAVFIDITSDDISFIKNREVRIVLYEYFGLLPESSVEFLRYLVFKATGSTLLIKNKESFEAIKTAADGNPFIVKAVRDYEQKYGLENLATIFYRFKPLFLALRANSNLKPIINKVRRLATVYHKPMEADYLNEVTAMLKHGVEIEEDVLQDKLSKVSVFRKIRLAQALQYRNGANVTSILYKIRNGKAFATEFSVDNKEDIEKVLNLVLESIVEDVKKNVDGKKIFIPDYIEYAMPATEKQFTGFFPSGTCVTVDKNMVFGVHWEDVKGSRIDLDLSLINADDVKIGWDGRYRNARRTALFSGDLTSAPLPSGSTELFYIDEADDSHYILFLNYYNFNSTIPVPFKILVAKEQIAKFKQNHMVDPNNVVCMTKAMLDVKQKMLGLVVANDTEIKFYFNESNLGRGITSSSQDYAKHARQYLFEHSINAISLNDVLVDAGAELVDDKTEAEIDLSPESLEKDTIISILQ
jgi:hypothetical protein